MVALFIRNYPYRVEWPSGKLFYGTWLVCAYTIVNLCSVAQANGPRRGRGGLLPWVGALRGPCYSGASIVRRLRPHDFAAGPVL